MRKRILIWIGLAMASAFIAASVASAADGVLTLSLSASPTKVEYPHSARLTVGFQSAEPATVAILAMPVGASEWTTTTLRAATSTFTVSVKPKVTTAYKAWINDETISTPVTVQVMAKLTKPQINGYKGSPRKGHSYTVKGTMQPREDSKVTVSFWRLESTTVLVKHGIGHLKRIKRDQWIQHGDSVQVPLTNVHDNSQMSKWSTNWKPDASGSWLIKVTHQDAAHVKSCAKTFKWVRL